MDSLHETARRWEMSPPQISVMGTGKPVPPGLVEMEKKNQAQKLLSGLIKDKLELVSPCASGDSARAQGEQTRKMKG